MARTSLVPQQPVFLSEADNKQLAEMDRQREAFNAAVEKYNQGVMGPGGYNEQLNAYIARLKEIEASGEEVPLPAAPTKMDVPVAPFTDESFVQAQEAAQARAQEAAGQRALAIQAFEDPSRFNLAGFAGLGSRTFAKGGEVKEEGTKASRMMKELGLSKPPKEKTLADEPSKQTPESLAYSLRAQAEGNRDKDLRKESFSAPGALNVKRFEEGGEARSKDRDDVSREIFEDVTFFKQSQPLPGQPEHERVRSDTLGFIKRMDDRSVMVAASKMSGMPVESPTQARVMLEQLLGGDASVSAGVMGSGRVLPDRVTGYSVGARMPAFGGQLNVGADIPRGQGRPMFNVGYRKEFQDGGEVMSPEEQPVVEESRASQALKELIRPVREGVKGYFGMDPESSGSEAYRTGQALSNMPGAGVPATLGIFIGKSSKLWNKAMNEAARKMEKSGAPPEEIWRKTGNFKGPDDQWRQEISDLGATQRMQVSQGPASMVLQHPELYQNYPDMKDLLIRTDPYAVRSSYTGSGVPGAEEISLGTAGGKLENIRGLLHEMQHGIQFREGFGLGGSKITAFNDPKAFEILEMVRKRVSTPATLEEFAKGAYQTTKITPKIEDEYKNLYLKNYAANLKSGGLDRMAQEEAARIYYNRLLGETEARAVEDRRLFTPEQRLEVFPTKSYKVDGKPVALEDLIIKRPMERAEGGPVNKHDAFIAKHQAGGPVSKGRRPVREAPPRAPQLDSEYTFGSEDAFEFTPAGTRNRLTRFIKSSAGDASNPAAKSFSDPQITRSREEFDRLAKSSKQPPMPSGVGGMFDAFVGPRGAIFVSPLGGPATYTHEMTHAADYNIGKLYRQASAAKEQKSNPAAQQFVDAYEKLVGGKERFSPHESRKKGAETFDAKWVEENKDYRSHTPELAAFAMENAMGGDRGQLTLQRGPLHLDPTLATEFTILTDLAQKYVDSRTNKPR